MDNLATSKPIDNQRNIFEVADQLIYISFTDLSIFHSLIYKPIAIYPLLIYHPMASLRT